jgi:hypothetical protein
MIRSRLYKIHQALYKRPLLEPTNEQGVQDVLACFGAIYGSLNPKAEDLLRRLGSDLDVIAVTLTLEIARETLGHSAKMYVVPHTHSLHSRSPLQSLESIIRQFFPVLL